MSANSETNKFWSFFYLNSEKECNNILLLNSIQVFAATVGIYGPGWRHDKTSIILSSALFAKRTLNCPQWKEIFSHLINNLPQTWLATLPACKTFDLKVFSSRIQVVLFLLIQPAVERLKCETRLVSLNAITNAYRNEFVSRVRIETQFN